jgi:hypothetical protein
MAQAARRLDRFPVSHQTSPAPTFAALGPPSRPAPPHPPRPESGRLLARSGPQSLTLAPLHPRLDSEPATAQDHWGQRAPLTPTLAFAPRPRRSGAPPGVTGQAGLPRRRPPPRRWP